MRAAVVTTPGGPEAITITEVPDPVPGPSDVVIAVEAAAVNPVDGQTRSGVYHALGWVTSTAVGLGWDAAGVITAVGSQVSGPGVGSRVAVLIAGVDRAHGAYAEQVAVPAADVALIPDRLATVDAATIPLNATTAAQALDLFGDPAGRSLLVTGAAGAVGGYALELARSRGFRVTGLARSGDEDFVTGTGVAFTSTIPTEPGFDVVLDAAALGEEALAAVVDAGHYVGVIPIAIPPSVRGITTQAVMATPDGELLARLLAAADRGELTPRVHSTLPLSLAGQAHRDLERGGLRGRQVLVP